MKSIIHIMTLDKFTVPYIDFINENFNNNQHKFIFITSEKYKYGLTHEYKVEFLHTDDDIFIKLLKYMKDADQIIIHGLWRNKVDSLLLNNKILFKKLYWIMWGGDFYFPENQTQNRREVIKNIKHCITYIHKDFEYVKKHYDTHAKLYECLMYPICILPDKFLQLNCANNSSNQTKILVGNSATQTNRHLEIFSILKNHKKNNLTIYVPLSYGNKEYRGSILKEGYKIFGNAFKPITTFLSFDDYVALLSSIDIAIFNHNRQQGGGNLNILLSLGKKVYLSQQSPYYKQYKNLGLNMYKVTDFTATKLSKTESMQNRLIMQKNFSLEKLKQQWKTIFE